MASSIQELYSVVMDLITSITSRFIVALIILLIGFIIGKLLGKVIKRALHEVEVNSIVKKITSYNIAVEEIVSGFVTYFVYFLAIVMALKHIGLATDILNILSAAVILVIVISIILSVKDIIPNVFAGFLIHQKKFLNVGDTVKVKNMEGKITEIALTEVMIESKKGDVIRIPNSIITNSEVIKKKSKSDK